MLDPVTILGVVKVCREVYDWYTDATAISDDEYDEVPEIDITEAREKIIKLKEKLAEIDLDEPEKDKEKT